MRRRLQPLLLFSALALCATAHSAPAHAAKPLPTRAQILGVPFVSWSEAARLRYPDKDLLDPSVPACEAMLIHHWMRDIRLLEHFEKITSDRSGEWTFVAKRENGTPDEIKGYLAQGFPVMVTPALTPVAHPLSPAALAMIAVGATKDTTVETLDRIDFTSGYLNRMAALDLFASLDTAVPQNDPSGRSAPQKRFWIRESARMAARLLIGYDDSRRIFLMHDPLSGPALEVGYDDFTAMWQATGNAYSLFYPSNYKEVQASGSHSAYRARTPDEEVAGYYVRGYALASVGRAAEAREQFRRGLEVEDIGVGGRHLLLVECALSEAALGDTDAAIDSAKRAVALLPQSAAGWKALARVYRGSTRENWQASAEVAEAQARRLARDRRAMLAVTQELPQNLREWSEWVRPRFSFRQVRAERPQGG